MCKHCKFLYKVFDFENWPDKTNREYWIFTEMFVYLHKGKDHCEFNN